ncbi:hypothetical protein D051_2694 [Vibrio parahaemolyticus VPCR-2010]|nr:hypothetical protein D051_2694 [Vibrio parahaemolyticus VPCR-2010]
MVFAIDNAFHSVIKIFERYIHFYHFYKSEHLSNTFFSCLLTAYKKS